MTSDAARRTIDRTDERRSAMADADLMSNVTDELQWEPKVDSEAIAVAADDGKITLRGTVGSLREKREAQKAAERVSGVVSVANKLEVKLLNDDRRDDAELRGDVLQALMLDSMVPSTIDADVLDGYVTLTGTAEWKYQTDEAKFVAGNVPGVIDVLDETDLLNPAPEAKDIEHDITGAFERY
jgi:osmotically-inducible protein OsmY